MNFFSEINVEKHHAEAIARGLFAIAHSDGLHEREAALVGSFWADTGGTGGRKATKAATSSALPSAAPACN